MIVERRKYNRFMARPDTYAAIGPHFTKIGKVREISIDGLTFEYMSIMDNPSRYDTNITIFLCEDNFFLPDIPCRVISDLPNCSLDENSTADSIFILNQCAVQFKTISEGQKQRLECFLEQHTKGLAPIANEMITAPSFLVRPSDEEIPPPAYPGVSTQRCSK